MTSVFDAPQLLDELSAETCALLVQGDVQLALAEAGTGGEIARRLRVSPAGSAVLKKAHTYAEPADLAAALRVSGAKVDAFGPVSAMVAAEAAAELIDTYEGGWGLVVMAHPGNATPAPGVTGEGAVSAQGFIALGAPSATVIQQHPPDQIVRAAFVLLREQALRRLSSR